MTPLACLSPSTWTGVESSARTLSESQALLETFAFGFSIFTLDRIRASANLLRKREICFADGRLYLERYDLNGWMPGDDIPCAMITSVCRDTGKETVCGKRSAYVADPTANNPVREGCCQSCWDALADDEKWPDARPIPPRTNNVYLHHILLPDEDVSPHNHPWEWACSLVLHGGYLEHRTQHPMPFHAGTTHEYRPGDRNVIHSQTFHRIATVQPDTWTLFITGPKTSSWGFDVEGRGFVAWRDRLRERGIKPAY